MSKKPGRNSICPCGSGEKYKHCCGKASVQQPGNNFQLDLQTAWKLHQQGYLDQAMQIYYRLLEQQPNDPKLLYLIGAIYQARNDFQSAWQFIDAGINHGMSDPAAFYLYSELLIDRQEYDKAVTYLLKAVKKRPDFFEAQRLLGNVFFELQQYGDAEKHYRNALKLNDKDHNTHHNLAKTLGKRNNITEAVWHYEKAFELNPEHIETLAALAQTLEQSNQLDKAKKFSDLALNKTENQFNALLTSAKISYRKKAFNDALEFLDKVSIDSLPETNQIEILHQRSLVLDKMQHYAEAFNLQKQLNSRIGAIREKPFNKSVFIDNLQTTSDQVQAFNWGNHLHPSVLRRLPLQPIFVVGFFRSGTTLVHQILASHPEVMGAGELNFIKKLEQQIQTELGNDYLPALQKMPASKYEKFVAKLRNKYLSMAQVLADNYGKPKAKFIVDKYPFNILHLPLIKLIFPDAPIIQMVRDPIDTIISCFFTNFQDEYGWSDSLEDAAEVYLAVHSHSSDILALINQRRYLLKYELLVQNLEENIRILLDFIGLEWNDNCLHFHQNKNIPHTPSYAQVTEQIYSSSVGRSQHYAQYIPNNIFSILNDVRYELGYTSNK